MKGEGKEGKKTYSAHGRSTVEAEGVRDKQRGREVGEGAKKVKG